MQPPGRHARTANQPIDRERTLTPSAQIAEACVDEEHCALRREACRGANAHDVEEELGIRHAISPPARAT